MENIKIFEEIGLNEPQKIVDEYNINRSLTDGMEIQVI